MQLNSNYNPDVLTCLANLSNDEVFTPPTVVNQMLDMLPAELFRSSKTTFLDPVSKSGVFLREIAKRLMIGLEQEIPDIRERANHIFTRQLYGMSITELTSLISRRSVYCSKKANGRYSLCTEFTDEQGNIRFKSIEHTFVGGKCKYCGASEDVFGKKVRGSLESHAYEFIHTDNPEKLFPKNMNIGASREQNGARSNSAEAQPNVYKIKDFMKFDVIIGNPPYQLSDGDGAGGSSATPIYNKFIETAIKLNPRYLTMIVPSRWFSGGKGLDDFRSYMLSQTHLRELHDFLEADECFPGIEIKGGVNYFLWDNSYSGDCKVVMHHHGTITSEMSRPLLEKDGEYFIRYNEAISILRKVRKFNEPSLIKQISASKPYGFRSNFEDFKTKPDAEHNVLLLRYGDNGYIKREQIEKLTDTVEKNKVLISKAYGCGMDSFPHQILSAPVVVGPNTACTETYLVAGAYSTIEEAENLASYMKTRFFRFMVFLIKNTQNAARRVYQFVPLQDFSHPWTDAMLYEKYGLTEEEIAFIESMIRPME